MTIDPAVVIAAFSAMVTLLGTAFRIIYTDLRRQADYWREESNMWRDLAMTGTKMAEKTTDAALRKRP